MTSQPLVIAEHLQVLKSGRPVLDDITFRILPGVITGLVGPSGSGKTTLMRAMIGVQKYSGTLKIRGKPAGNTALRKTIGYVTQAPAVYHDITVVQNLRYFGTVARAPKGQIDEVMEQVRLTGKRHQLVGSLSGGETARVSLAVALLGNPEVLVLDEPTVGLDPLLREELWGLFAELAKQGKTLLISSHVMDEAEKCENLLMLRSGKLLWSGPKKKFLEETHTSSVQAAFLAAIRGEKQ